MKLKDNPFRILGVGPEAGREEIVDRAQALDLDEGENRGSEARRVLTTPRLRIRAEVGWIWGIESNAIAEAVSICKERALDAALWRGVTPLGRLNLGTAALDEARSTNASTSPSSYNNTYATTFRDEDRRMRELMEKMDQCSRIIDWRNVRDSINAVRELSDFAPARDEKPIRDALKEQVGEAVEAVCTTLNRLESVKLVQIVTDLVNEGTRQGEGRSGRVIWQLVQRYELEAQPFLDREGRTLEALKAKAIEKAEGGAEEKAVKRVVNVLLRVLRNWDKVAQPIQISMRSRGQRHERTYEMAMSIRSLGLKLWNEFHMKDPAREIIATMEEVFAEEAEVAELVARDRKATG